MATVTDDTNPLPALLRAPNRDLMQAVAVRAMEYRFKLRTQGVWGFGEDICLRALLEYGKLTGDPKPLAFVVDLVRPWCLSSERLTNADHVAPGVVILELYQATGDDAYLRAALRLGDLCSSFAEVNGVAVHRLDLAGLSSLIWVDCLALDGPFLARLAQVTGDDAWRELAVRTTRAYAGVLLDPHQDLFRHGYDVLARQQSPCNWGRGNGWAMHGLVDTLAELSPDHPARTELVNLLVAQLRSVARLQSPGGLWHTILDDPDSPLENSTAAFFASAVLKAGRLGLLDPGDHAALVGQALSALAAATTADGSLPVSYATPVGEPEAYYQAPQGVFPWGQGPLLLTLIESQLQVAAARNTAQEE